MRTSALLASLVLASVVEAKLVHVVDDLSKPDLSASLWKGSEGFGGVSAADAALHLHLPFSSITQAQRDNGWWGMFAEGTYALDLTKADRIRIKIRGNSTAALNRIAIAFGSGGGSYQPSQDIGCTSEWTTVDVPLATLSSWGNVEGLSKIRGIAFSFSTAQKNDAWVEIGGIELHKGLDKEDAGRVGALTGWTEAQQWFEARSSHPNKVAIDLRRQQAQAQLDSISGDVGLLSNQNRILMAKHLLGEAYALAQTPATTKEDRVLWVHQGHGSTKSDGTIESWSSVLPKVAAAGYTRVVPNVLWSGAAYYPSKVVPDSVYNVPKKDYVREILDVAKPLGLEVHAWKVMFQFGTQESVPGTKDRLVKEKGLSLQVNQQGETTDLLSPCDEKVVQYEIAQLTEVVKMYPDLSGVQMDYIRYWDSSVDYAPACRQAFEQSRGAAVAKWPEDVVSGSARVEYDHFRRGVISAIVRRVRDSVKAVRPSVTVGAAVFANPATAYHWQLQDWTLWAKNGWLDEVTPMLYTANVLNFGNMLRDVKALSSGVTVLPAIGSWMNDVGDVAEQIAQTRAVGTLGYGLFQLDERFHTSLMPFIGRGMHDKTALELPDTRAKFFETLMKEPNKGTAVALTAGKATHLDNFDDGDMVSLLGTSWSAAIDGHGQTSLEEPVMLGDTLSVGNGYARMKGFIGMQAAPWPWAQLCLPLDKNWGLADITGFEKLAFKIRGDGKPVSVVLGKESVKDYGNFSALVPTSSQWTTQTLSLTSFVQPGWAKAQLPVFSDVLQLCFSTVASAKPFAFEVDDVQLLPPGAEFTVSALPEAAPIQVSYRAGRLQLQGLGSIIVADVQGRLSAHRHGDALVPGVYMVSGQGLPSQMLVVP